MEDFIHFSTRLPEPIHRRKLIQELERELREGYFKRVTLEVGEEYLVIMIADVSDEGMLELKQILKRFNREKLRIIK